MFFVNKGLNVASALMGSRSKRKETIEQERVKEPPVGNILCRNVCGSLVT